MQTNQQNFKRFWETNTQNKKQWTSQNNQWNIISDWKRTKCEIYTRVMWYYRPVSFFNEWKKSEYYSRKYFEENISFNSKFCEDFE